MSNFNSKLEQKTFFLSQQISVWEICTPSSFLLVCLFFPSKNNTLCQISRNIWKFVFIKVCITPFYSILLSVFLSAFATP